MYKRDDKSRFLILYGLTLLVLGLCVMLVAAKVTNSRILANNEERMQDALKNIEENEKDILENYIYSDEIENGYKLINLGTDKKEQINFDILTNSLIDLLISTKEYTDYNGYFAFNSGDFTSDEMMNYVLSLENTNSMDILTLKNESDLIFGKQLKEEEISYYVNNGIVNIDEKLPNKECILKVKKVFKNSENSSYDIFVDEIYPVNPEDYETYKQSSKTYYSEEEIVNTYKIRVNCVDNVYKFVSIELINVD